MPCNKSSEATDRTASTTPVGGGAVAAAAAGCVVVVAFFGGKAMMRNSTQRDRQQCPELPTATGPQRSTGSSMKSSCSMQHKSFNESKNTCDPSAAARRKKIPSSVVMMATWEKLPSSSDVIHSRPVSASERGLHNSQQVAVSAAAAGARPGGDHCHDDDDARTEENTHEASETMTPAQGQASFYLIDFPLKCTAVLTLAVCSRLIFPTIRHRGRRSRSRPA